MDEEFDDEVRDVGSRRKSLPSDSLKTKAREKNDSAITLFSQPKESIKPPKLEDFTYSHLEAFVKSYRSYKVAAEDLMQPVKAIHKCIDPENTNLFIRVYEEMLLTGEKECDEHTLDHYKLRSPELPTTREDLEEGHLQWYIDVMLGEHREAIERNSLSENLVQAFNAANVEAKKRWDGSLTYFVALVEMKVRDALLIRDEVAARDTLHTEFLALAKDKKEEVYKAIRDKQNVVILPKRAWDKAFGSRLPSISEVFEEARTHARTLHQVLDRAHELDKEIFNLAWDLKTKAVEKKVEDLPKVKKVQAQKRKNTNPDDEGKKKKPKSEGETNEKTSAGYVIEVTGAVRNKSGKKFPARCCGISTDHFPAFHDKAADKWYFCPKLSQVEKDKCLARSSKTKDE